jgi:hypothetical protein
MGLLRLWVWHLPNGDRALLHRTGPPPAVLGRIFGGGADFGGASWLAWLLQPLPRGYCCLVWMLSPPLPVLG